MKIKRYKQFNEDAVATTSTSGMGGVVSAQPGSLPGTTGTEGTDLTFTFKKGKSKKGNPSQVTDLGDLEPAKTEKIEDIKESINQKGNLNMDQIHIINESLSELYDMGFELTTLENDGSDDDDNIRISLHKMINVNWTGNMTIKYEFDKNEITKKRLSTLRGSGSKLTTDEQELINLVDDISHTLINMLGYTKGIFDISYLVAGSAMPVNRNVNVNIHIGLFR